MNTLPKRFAAVALATATLGGSLAMADSRSPAVLSLTCQTAAGVSSKHAGALCAALTKRLTEETPAWKVQPADAGADAEASMTLTVLGEGKSEISAKLSWQRGDQSGESPEHTFSVMDTKLGSTSFDGFLGVLLRSTDWPDAG